MLVTAEDQQPDRRHHHQQHDRSNEHAAHHHGSKRSLHLAADGGGESGGEQTDAGRHSGHQHRPHPLFGGVRHGLGGLHAGASVPIVIGNHQDSVHHRHAEQRNEADGGRNASNPVM